MKAKYIQKGDAVDYIPNQDMDAGEIVCLGNLIGITRIPIKAGTLGTLTLSGVFDIIKQAGVTFSWRQCLLELFFRICRAYWSCSWPCH